MGYLVVMVPFMVLDDIRRLFQSGQRIAQSGLHDLPYFVPAEPDK
jgi:hypothetical protein